MGTRAQVSIVAGSGCIHHCTWQAEGGRSGGGATARRARLNDVGPVVVEVPQLAVVLLVRPPEGVRPAARELLVLLAAAPADVEGERVAVLLEERVDARDAPVPAVLEVLLRARARAPSAALKPRHCGDLWSARATERPSSHAPHRPRVRNACHQGHVFSNLEGLHRARHQAAAHAELPCPPDKASVRPGRCASTAPPRPSTWPVQCLTRRQRP